MIDSADLELPVLDRSLDTSFKREDTNDTDSEADASSLKLVLHPAVDLWPQNGCAPQMGLANSYFCLHSFGIHHVRITWVESLREGYSSLLIDEKSQTGKPCFMITLNSYCTPTFR